MRLARFVMRARGTGRCAILLIAVLMSTACSSGSDAEPAEPTEPAATAAPEVTAAPSPPAPANNIVVSDAVPTIEELRAMGLADEVAECFINTIDPENTGIVESAELFMEAFGACL